ncbi:MAG: 50S ribosomal protein L6 [Candidatus Ryanbacteria bacterium RIFCSPLOWO2_01_FULL_48_26]|uniref:Large ribosomal subunit protein uL6 n=1 Tax=Candidatus Ryanbacteria bacterium RIFCSPLOWO2_01_FULL_48_26 TaxID=1802126 RepID=A0A1G2GVW5_9BACT|nr:MAG: 50S ribosomal protein L6 [Candidatus Ryanbacteria bacterium RIFCSPLOWO2_01_FULL_48_26]
MSRIGKKPVVVPSGVTVAIKENEVEVKGPLGSLRMAVHPLIEVREEGDAIILVPRRQTKESPKLWGTTRALIANMIEGVVKGYEKKLELEGVGYRAELKDKGLELQLGFSHPVRVEAPAGVQFKVEKNLITVSGYSKEDVGRVASSIRALKKPEPYKGKGIHYLGEVIRRKAGKKATTSA